MDEIIQLVIKSYGVIGLIMLAPYVALVYLWKQTRDLNQNLLVLAGSSSEKIVAAGVKIEEAQKQRVQDAQAIMDRLVTMVTEQSGLNKETNLALERLSDLMSMMSTAPGKPRT